MQNEEAASFEDGFYSKDYIMEMETEEEPGSSMNSSMSSSMTRSSHTGLQEPPTPLPPCCITLRTIHDLNSYPELCRQSANCLATNFNFTTCAAQSDVKIRRLIAISNTSYVFLLDAEVQGYPLLRYFPLTDLSTGAVLQVNTLALGGTSYTAGQSDDTLRIFAAGILPIRSAEQQSDVTAVLCSDLRGLVLRKRQYKNKSVLDLFYCARRKSLLIILLKDDTTQLVELCASTLQSQSVHNLSKTCETIFQLTGDHMMLCGPLKSGGTLLCVWTHQDEQPDSPEDNLQAWGLPEASLVSFVSMEQENSSQDGHLLVAINAAAENSLWYVWLDENATHIDPVLARFAHHPHNRNLYFTALAPIWCGTVVENKNKKKSGPGVLALKENSLILVRRKLESESAKCVLM